MVEDLTPDEALSKVIEEFDDDGQSFSNVYGGFSKLENGIYSRGAETMKQIVFNRDLSQSEIRVAILKNLMDSKLVEIIKEENPVDYRDLKSGEYNRILEALGMDNTITELTDEDVMDIARKRFKWGDYDDGNVAYNIYKFKHGNGEIETGVIFARSGSQELFELGEKSNLKGYSKNFKSYEKARRIIEILNKEILKNSYMSQYLWHSEFKISATIIDRLINEINDVEEIELSWASERGYCLSSCDTVLKNLIDYLVYNTKSERISFITHNDVIQIRKGTSWEDYGIRGVRFKFKFFNLYF
ncbi:MAG: hypothetical protein P8Y97_20435 [Candidatus Lokiarchaeota archaeon]